MATLTELQTTLTEKKANLAKVEGAGQGYRQGSFRLDRVQAEGLREEIAGLEMRIAFVENACRGSSVVFGGHLG
ncbi:MAG: hypothetical protein KAJ62_12455 [Desulfobacteraceae bacterium]|nr:hypothetical protein [Desulfobacteraceae bacterium]